MWGRKELFSDVHSVLLKCRRRDLKCSLQLKGTWKMGGPHLGDGVEGRWDRVGWRKVSAEDLALQRQNRVCWLQKLELAECGRRCNAGLFGCWHCVCLLSLWCYQRCPAPHLSCPSRVPLLHKTLPFLTACILLVPNRKDFSSQRVFLVTPPDSALTKTLLIFTHPCSDHPPACSCHGCQLLI